MKTNFNFITQFYFPGRVIWAVVAVVAMVAFIAAYFYLLAVLAGIGGVLFFTTCYGVEIDLAKKQYREYTWVLGFRIGERLRFESIHYLYIKDINLSQTFNSRFINTTTISFKEYRGYVKFSEEEKIHILTGENHEKLITAMTKTAQAIQSRLFDYSSGQPVQLV